MPASTRSQPISIEVMSQQAETQLLKQVPYLSERITTLLRNRFYPEQVSSPPAALVSQKPTVEKVEVTQQEFLSIVQKLHDVTQLPTALLDQETALYLEQQISDMLGFEVTSQLQGHTLSFSKGTIDSLPHLPRDPKDKHLPPDIIKEAPKQNYRSYYGWTGISHDENQLELLTPYWVAVPTSSLSPNDKGWLFRKKIILINATNAICIVASILDNYIDVTNKHQLGGSPAVIRHGLFWSPQNLGKFLSFFVPDQNNSIKPGVYQLLAS